MSKNKTKAITTAVLLLEILHYFPKRRKVTAQYILERLESAGHNIDIRTVQRHLKSLREHDGFDIEYDDRNKPYGYRWLPEAKTINWSQPTPQESLLLRLAEHQLTDLLPAKVKKNLSGFFKQAKTNLDFNSPDKQKNILEKQWLKKVRVVPARQPLLPPEIKEGVIEVVSDALYGNHWLELNYKNRNDHKSTPTVMPLGLAQQGERLYLVCRYKNYSDARSLALHRVKSAKKMLDTFDYPDDFDLEKYDDEGRFLFGDGKKIRLTFNVKKDHGKHLYETRLSKDQKITDNNDYLTITATVVDSEALTWWLNGFGDAVFDVQKIDY